MRIDEIDFGGAMKLDAYGDGGFRISGHFHAGSLMLLPSGPKPWRPLSADDLSIDDFADAAAERDDFEVLLLGTGARFKPLPKDLRHALMAAGLKVEFMDTGAAARTFNVLLNENRRVAAAMIAID
jgi:uncharacterized protein